MIRSELSDHRPCGIVHIPTGEPVCYRCRRWCDTNKLQATSTEVASREESEIRWSFFGQCYYL